MILCDIQVHDLQIEINQASGDQSFYTTDVCYLDFT